MFHKKLVDGIAQLDLVGIHLGKKRLDCLAIIEFFIVFEEITDLWFIGDLSMFLDVVLECLEKMLGERGPVITVAWQLETEWWHLV